MRTETRGQELGIQPGALEKKCLDRLATIKKSLIEIAAQWGDVDNTVVMEVDSTVQQVEALETTVKECAAYLREKPE